MIAERGYATTRAHVQFKLARMFSPGKECLDWVSGWLVNGASREGRDAGTAGSCATGRVGIRSGPVGLAKACRGPCRNSSPLRGDGRGEVAMRGVESRYLQPSLAVAIRRMAAQRSAPAHRRRRPCGIAGVGDRHAIRLLCVRGSGRTVR